MKKIDLGTISMGNSGHEEPYGPVHQAEPARAHTADHGAAAECPCEDNSRNDFYYGRCEDAKSCDLGEMALDTQGRILDLSMCLKNVCPGKRVAVGVVLTEVDENNNEYPRGQKTFTVPAHNNSSCTDIPVASMRFVMPEDISVSGSDDICCNNRHFIARVAAHYIDVTSNCYGCDGTSAAKV